MWTLIRLLLEEQSDLGTHCLQNDLKSQADDKVDDNCCDWQFKGLDHVWDFLKAVLLVG